jgi:hypothetical protein
LVQAQVSIFYSGAWHVITADTRMPIHISRGMPNEASRSDPAVVTLRLNNGTSNVESGVVGRYSPKNPRSDLFGLIGRGTPVKVEAGLVGGGLTTRVVGEVVQWPARWDVSERDLWVDLEVSGILRRLGSAGRPLSDPIARLAALHGPVGYWPLHDIEGSTQGRAAVGGKPMVPAAAIDSAQFGKGQVVPWLEPGMLTGLTDGGTIVARLPAPAGGWTLDVLFRGPDPASWGTQEPQFFYIQAIDEFPIAYRALIAPDVGDLEVTVVNGGSLGGGTVSLGDLLDGQPHHLRMEAVEASGNNVTVNVYVDGVLRVTDLIDIGVATAPELSSVRIGWFSFDSWTVPAACSDFMLWAPADAPTLAQAYAAYTGHANETAGNRAVRLCAEEGVTLTTFGDLNGSMPMGAQRSADLLALLDECAATESSGSRLPILTETRDELGLTFRTRRSLYLIS